LLFQDHKKFDVGSQEELNTIHTVSVSYTNVPLIMNDINFFSNQRWSWSRS